MLGQGNGPRGMAQYAAGWWGTLPQAPGYGPGEFRHQSNACPTTDSSLCPAASASSTPMVTVSYDGTATEIAVVSGCGWLHITARQAL